MDNPPTSTIQSDHDMLVGLNVKMDQVTRDIRNIGDGTAARIADMETRMRSVEKRSETYDTVKNIVYGLVGLILVAIIGGLLSQVLR